MQLPCKEKRIMKKKNVNKQKNNDRNKPSVQDEILNEHRINFKAPQNKRERSLLIKFIANCVHTTGSIYPVRRDQEAKQMCFHARSFRILLFAIVWSIACERPATGPHPSIVPLIVVNWIHTNRLIFVRRKYAQPASATRFILSNPRSQHWNDDNFSFIFIVSSNAVSSQLRRYSVDYQNMITRDNRTKTNTWSTAPTISRCGTECGVPYDFRLACGQMRVYVSRSGREGYRAARYL